MPRKGGVVENLKPFPKGKSGNPNGRPKLPDIKEALIKILSNESAGKTDLDRILLALKAKALKGDVRSAQELLDRAFGKAQQLIDVKGGVFLKFDHQDEQV
jgi:hypothetical protein